MKKQSNFHYLRCMLLIFLIIGVTANLAGNKRQEGPYVVLSFSSKRMPDKIELAIKVFSGQKSDLRVPTMDNLYVGYEHDELADCFFEVYKDSSSQWLKDYPTTDYQTYNIKKTLTSLHKGQTIHYLFNLAKYYRLKLNKRYKIRVVFKFSKYNSEQDAYSPWIILSTSQ